MINDYNKTDIEAVIESTDGCSSGPLKYLSWLYLKILKVLSFGLINDRNYRCICFQHDFDYKFGPKYEITKNMADDYLLEGVRASGHPIIAYAMYKGVQSPGGDKAWDKHRQKEEK